MKNQVIAGDYNGWDFVVYGDRLYLMRGLKKIAVDKTNVASYEIVNDVHNHSFWKPLLAGGIGGMVFGPLGMMAGVSSASRNKQQYWVSVEFTDGKKSLIQMDTRAYSVVVRALF